MCAFVAPIKTIRPTGSDCSGAYEPMQGVYYVQTSVVLSYVSVDFVQNFPIMFKFLNHFS